MAGQVKDREAFQRLSFLYQAAHCVLAQDPENQALARFYCHTERTIAKRLVLRRDPSVKRTLCRGCSSLLIPGLTCTQRQRRCKAQRWTVQTCLTCQRSQRFLNDPRHLLWGDRPEAQLGSQADSSSLPVFQSYSPPKTLPATREIFEEQNAILSFPYLKIFSGPHNPQLHIVLNTYKAKAINM
ncbi:ribonuclease P protein subunit p21 isoform X1 [Physeter macrocephalus]|uniref:Ribonuclease P protein subunit p21 isoform X1 n=1 Tax=Physeter macrocephalus TaxID=9755 RepID=A0A2Y9EP17_PHYMC|nr:ribonuclease P protein subunit p21 isoform X1 [Physeter catodon]|eukprot:XP_007106367.1 ribonuclease P protein subunit p21 isoform X1 [Physeter catodon]